MGRVQKIDRKDADIQIDNWGKMYKGKKVLALIPARGGSKGLPGKNIKELCGKPLIAWTIEQARGSEYIDKTIVSTDDNKIAEISKKFGVELPFIRPRELAGDTTRSVEVILHAIDAMRNMGQSYDILVLLQPTSPLRTKEDIDSAIDLLFLKKAKAIVSVCEVDHHPCWINTLPLDRCMKDFIKEENLNKNRQELNIFYRLNGAIYVSYCDYIEDQKSFMGSGTFAYVMPQDKSIDIDNEVDFALAQTLMKELTGTAC